MGRDEGGAVTFETGFGVLGGASERVGVGVGLEGGGTGVEGAGGTTGFGRVASSGG